MRREVNALLDNTWATFLHCYLSLHNSISRHNFSCFFIYSTWPLLSLLFFPIHDLPLLPELYLLFYSSLFMTCLYHLTFTLFYSSLFTSCLYYLTFTLSSILLYSQPAFISYTRLTINHPILICIFLLKIYIASLVTASCPTSSSKTTAVYWNMTPFISFNLRWYFLSVLPGYPFYFSFVSLVCHNNLLLLNHHPFSSTYSYLTP